MPERFERFELAELERCYAVRALRLGSETRLLYATEGRGPCLQFDAHTLQRLENVWDEPGGTMSIIPIPGKPREILAVQRFFPTFQAPEARIAWGVLTEEGHWELHDFVSLPYVHRFDLLPAQSGCWFVGATLCTAKRDKEDWSSPGKVWVGRLPESWHDPMPLTALLEPLTRNHGYCHVFQNGLHHGVVTCDEGVFCLTPPSEATGDWRMERLLSEPVSDISFVDIDGDGRLEGLAIEPFHGERMTLYRWGEAGLEPIWRMPFPTEFGHVTWGGILGGRPAFLAGYRKGKAELLLLRADGTGGLSVQAIDAGEGPSNIDVTTIDGRDCILAANRMTGKAALYRLLPEEGEGV